MKFKIAIIILAIACIGLGVALFATKKQGDDQHTTDVNSINDFSNQLVGANTQLKDLSQANLALTNDLALSRDATAGFSNSLVSVNTTLDSTKSSLLNAQGQITNLNSQISDLEVQNKVLDQRAADLTNTIAQMDAVINSTESKLSVAETNTIFLQGELQKQMTQKAELEHKFNDVNEVRAQVKKLRDEMFIARRMQLNKYDNTGKKGAQLLMAHATPPSTNAPAGQPPNYNLNVEVGTDGSVRIIPPLGVTNSPAR
jgi:chromosome segregation ATPase